jgi:hypothetical protein
VGDCRPSHIVGAPGAADRGASVLRGRWRGKLPGCVAFASLNQPADLRGYSVGFIGLLFGHAESRLLSISSNELARL